MAATEQRIVTVVEYKLTDIDTPVTARARAIDKALLIALEESQREYASISTFNENGQQSSEFYADTNNIVRHNVLSGKQEQCKDGAGECYNVQVEAFIMTDAIPMTLEALDEMESIIKTSQDLLKP